MDFHSMQRKSLQALCKKHNLHANGKNSDLADRLASHLKKPEMESKTRKKTSEIADRLDSHLEKAEEEPKSKKVRFNKVVEISEVTGRSTRSRRVSEVEMVSLGSSKRKRGVSEGEIKDSVEKRESRRRGVEEEKSVKLGQSNGSEIDSRVTRSSRHSKIVSDEVDLDSKENGSGTVKTRRGVKGKRDSDDDIGKVTVDIITKRETRSRKRGNLEGDIDGKSQIEHVSAHEANASRRSNRNASKSVGRENESLSNEKVDEPEIEKGVSKKAKVAKKPENAQRGTRRTAVSNEVSDVRADVVVEEKGVSRMKTRRGLNDSRNNEDDIGTLAVSKTSTRDTRSRKRGTTHGDTIVNSQIAEEGSGHASAPEENVSRRPTRYTSRIDKKNELLSKVKVDQPENKIKEASKETKISKQPEKATRRSTRKGLADVASVSEEKLRADVIAAEGEKKEWRPVSNEDEEIGVRVTRSLRNRGVVSNELDKNHKKNVVSLTKTRKGLKNNQNNEDFVSLAVSKTTKRETRSIKRGNSQGDIDSKSQIEHASAPELHVSRGSNRNASRIVKENESLSSEKVDEPEIEIPVVSKKAKIVKEPENAQRRSRRTVLTNEVADEHVIADVAVAENVISPRKRERGLKDIQNNEDGIGNLAVSNTITRETRSQKRGDTQGDKALNSLSAEGGTEHASTPEENASRRQTRNTSRIDKQSASLSKKEVDQPGNDIQEVSKKNMISKQPEKVSRGSTRKVSTSGAFQSEEQAKTGAMAAENLFDGSLPVNTSPQGIRRSSRVPEANLVSGLSNGHTMSIPETLPRSSRSQSSKQKQEASTGAKRKQSRPIVEENLKPPKRSSSRRVSIALESEVTVSGEVSQKKALDDDTNQTDGKSSIDNNIGTDLEMNLNVADDGKDQLQVSSNDKADVGEALDTCTESPIKSVIVNTSPEGSRRSRRVPETNFVSGSSNEHTMSAPVTLPRSCRSQSSKQKPEASTGAKRKQKSQSIVEEKLITPKRSSPRHVSIALESEVANSGEVSQKKDLDDGANQSVGKSAEDNSTGTNLEMNTTGTNINVADEGNDQVQVIDNDKGDVGEALDICTESPIGRSYAACPENNPVGGDSENLFLRGEVNACENTSSAHNNDSTATKICLHELEEETSHQHDQIESSLDDGHLAPNGSSQCYVTNDMKDGSLDCSELSSCNNLNKSEQAEEQLVGAMDNPVEDPSKKTVLEPVRRIQEDVLEEMQPSAEFDRGSSDESLILERQKIVIDNTAQFSLGNSDDNTQQQNVDVSCEVSEKEGFIGNSSDECGEEHVNVAVSSMLQESLLLPRKSSISGAHYHYESSDTKPLKQVQKELVHSRKEVVTDVDMNSDHVTKVDVSLLSKKSLVEDDDPSDSGCIASASGIKEPCEARRENALNSLFHTSEATGEDGSSSQGYKVPNSSLIDYKLSGNIDNGTGTFVEISEKVGDRESLPGANIDNTVQYSERSSEGLECRAAYGISTAQGSPCVGVGEPKVVFDSIDQKEFLGVEENVITAQVNMEELDELKEQVVESEEIAIGFDASGDGVEEPCDSEKNNAGTTPMCSLGISQEKDSRSSGDIVSKFDDPATVGLEECKATDDITNEEEFLNIERSVGISQRNMEAPGDGMVESEEVANTFHVSVEGVQGPLNIGKEDAGGISHMCSSQTPRENDSSNAGDIVFEFDDHVAVDLEELKCTEDSKGPKDTLDIESSLGALQRSMQELDEPQNQMAEDANRFDASGQVIEESHDIGKKNAGSSPLCSSEISKANDWRSSGDEEFKSDVVGDRIVANSAHGIGGDDLMFSERKVDQVEDVVNEEGNVAIPRHDAEESFGKEKHVRESIEVRISGKDSPRNATGLPNEVASEGDGEYRYNTVDNVLTKWETSLIYRNDAENDDETLTHNRDRGNSLEEMVTVVEVVTDERFEDNSSKVDDSTGTLSEAEGKFTKSPHYPEEHDDHETQMVRKAEDNDCHVSVDKPGEIGKDNEYLDTINQREGEISREHSPEVATRSTSYGSGFPLGIRASEVDGSTGALSEAEGKFNKSPHYPEEHDDHETQMVRKAEDNDCHVSVDKPGEIGKDNEYLDTINQREGEISREHSPEVATGSTSYGSGFPLGIRASEVDSSTGALSEAEGKFHKSPHYPEEHDDHETQMVRKAEDNDCHVSVDKPGEIGKDNEYLDTINQREGEISREHSPKVATGSTSYGSGFPLGIRGDDVVSTEPFDDEFSTWDMDSLSGNAGNDDLNFVGNETRPNLKFEDIGNNVEGKDPSGSGEKGDPINLLPESEDNSGNNFVHVDGATGFLSEAERSLPQNLEDQETRYQVQQADDKDFSGEIEKDTHILDQNQVERGREEEALQTATCFPLCGSDFPLENAEANQGEGEVSFSEWEVNFLSGNNAQDQETTFTEENRNCEKLFETMPADPTSQATGSTSENANRRE
ncbi:hypothetical protein ACHQM5_022034 [Ranunculus cassubicifolius]